MLRGLSWQEGEVTFVMVTKNKHSSNVSSNAQAPQQASAQSANVGVLTARRPSAVDEGINLVNQASKAFGTPVPALSKADKRHVAKPYPSIEKVIPTLASLAIQHGVVLSKHPVDEMTGSMQTAQALAPLRAAIVAYLKKVDDAILSANGDAWSTATLYYSVMLRVAANDAELEAALQPLTPFFNLSAKAKKKAGKIAERASQGTQPRKGKSAQAAAGSEPAATAPVAPPAHSDAAPAQAGGGASTPSASSS